MRLLVPGRRRGRSLGGLTRRAAGAALAFAAVTALIGCGGAHHPPARRLALGFTELNPHLVGRLPGPEPKAFARWRDTWAALHPRYYRIFVNWAAVQPRPHRPPDWSLPIDGCVREIRPCAGYRGVADELRAVRGAGYQVVVTFIYPPAWATVGAGTGCQLPTIDPRSRAVSAAGVSGYRAMVDSLLALTRRLRVDVRWWSPWNEINNQSFGAPQRAACAADARSLAVAHYVPLARAMRAALAAAPGDQQMVLGELSTPWGPGRYDTTPPEFAAALPPDVLCSGSVWAQHIYVGDDDPLPQLEHALAATSCGRRLRIWITETGAGGIPAGKPRPMDAPSLLSGCRELDALLHRWDSDPRVDAAFQYTLRDDPAFPVGVVDSTLRHAFPAFAAWKDGAC